MKRFSLLSAIADLAAIVLVLLLTSAPTQAQVQPQNLVTTISVVKTGVTGTTTAVLAPAANKTYQVVASVASGTGTAAITVEGSNDALHWDPIASLTVTSSVAGASTSTTSTDRYGLLRGNVTTLSGSTPTLSLTAGF